MDRYEKIAQPEEAQELRIGVLTEQPLTACRNLQRMLAESGNPARRYIPNRMIVAADGTLFRLYRPDGLREVLDGAMIDQWLVDRAAVPPSLRPPAEVYEGVLCSVAHSSVPDELLIQHVSLCDQ